MGGRKKMSICFCANLQQKCLNQELLYQILSEYWSEYQILQQQEERCIFYKGMENGIAGIAFIEQKTYPYSIYISDILGKEYHIAQSILFLIDKMQYSIDTYQKIIDFCIFLKSKINSNLLLISDVHNEICFLNKNGILWAENSFLKNE